MSLAFLVLQRGWLYLQPHFLWCLFEIQRAQPGPVWDIPTATGSRSWLMSSDYSLCFNEKAPRLLSRLLAHTSSSASLSPQNPPPVLRWKTPDVCIPRVPSLFGVRCKRARCQSGPSGQKAVLNLRLSVRLLSAWRTVGYAVTVRRPFGNMVPIASVRDWFWWFCICCAKRKQLCAFGESSSCVCVCVCTHNCVWIRVRNACKWIFPSSS